MALQEKYAELVAAAQTAGVANLLVREQDGVLYIDGEAPSEAAKQQLWDIYGRIDPEYRSADVVMHVTVNATAAAPAVQQYEVVSGDNLSKIGSKYGKTWKEIYDANKEVIGADPNKIFPGQVLTIPA